MVTDHMTTLSPTIMVVAAGFMVWGGGGVGGRGGWGMWGGGAMSPFLPVRMRDVAYFYNGPGTKKQTQSYNLLRTKYA